MPTSNRSTYKGYQITTRWIELGPLNLQPHRFTASFTVDPTAANESSWQQFPKAIFDTHGGAAENALTAAKKSIDLELAAASSIPLSSLFTHPRKST